MLTVQLKLSCSILMILGKFQVFEYGLKTLFAIFLTFHFLCDKARRKQRIIDSNSWLLKDMQNQLLSSLQNLRRLFLRFVSIMTGI